MKNVLFTFSSLLVLSFISFPAMAASPAADGDEVQACKYDAYVSERIEEHVPVEERRDILNSKNEVVGALHIDAPSGEMHAIYLCGANDGYYYAEGNIQAGSLVAFYNDEYDSEFETEVTDSHLIVHVKSVTFAGDPEDGYPTFAVDLFISLR